MQSLLDVNVLIALLDADHTSHRSARAATADRMHTFWPDSESLLDARLFDATRVHGPRQLTDVYLLGLAVRNGGRLVTFDASIAIGAVKGAKAQHLLQL